MHRRAFVGALAGGLVAASRVVGAAPAERTIRVGVLYPGVDNSIFRENFAGFGEALGTAGYVEGRNLKLDVRSGDGHELAPIANDIVTLRPDLVLAVGRPGVVAAHAATSTIPVVAVDLESDPVASGFVHALAKPGGNITGVFMDFPDLAGKWLEILKAIVPTLARVAVLWDPATGPAQLEAARRAARLLKTAVFTVEAPTIGEIEPAVRAAMRERPSGMISLTSPLFSAGRRNIVEVAARYRLPTLVPFSGFAKDGGLVSYGPEIKTMYAQAGALAAKILAGRSPADIPVERPTRFVLALNLKTAKTLGLKVPEPLLQRTDEVIQ